jgi:integrase
VATVYQRGDCWYLNWRENGRQWRRSLGKIDAGAAEKEKRAVEARLTLGLEATPHSPTLSEWIDDYCDSLEAEGKGKKRRSELRHAKQRLGHLHIASLPARLVEDYLVSRLRDAKPETVGKEIRLLKAAMNRAVALEIIERNPIAGIKPPRGVTSKAVTFYTKRQLEALYKADRELAPLWRFMVNTGLRRGEFAKAHRSDVVGGVLRVESTEEGRTKSGRWREVPLNVHAKAALKLLGKDRLSPYAADTLTHRFAKVATAAGVDGNLHLLRHTFCSHLVMAGVSLRAVQLLAGHSTVAVTERYSHLAPSKKAEAVNMVRL